MFAKGLGWIWKLLTSVLGGHVLSLGCWVGCAGMTFNVAFFRLF